MFDLVIVRAYVTFPDEGGGVDRYITLHNYALKSGLNSLLCSSTYLHNKKSSRYLKNPSISKVHLIDAGGYISNLSIQRLFFELKFAYKAYKFVRQSDAKSVLIGEPLFLGWIFFMWLRLTKGTIIFGDFIDLMPEAYLVKFRYKLWFWSLFWIFYVTRWARANLFYDKVFTVSQSYTNKILIISKRAKSTFYWGINKKQVSNIKINKSKIVYAGSLGEGYDIEILIELAIKRPNLEVVIAGAGPKSDLCRRAHDQGIITFLGQLDSEGLECLYKGAYYGVLPYKKNSAVSMPIKFYEYLAHELVIINSLNMECSEVIDEFGLGCNYLPEDLSSLCDAIDTASKISISRNVIKGLLSKYSVEYQYKSFVSNIYNMLESR